MRIEIENGYIENLKNPTREKIKFFIQGELGVLAIDLTLRQLTLLRENFNNLIDYLQEDHEPNDAA